MSVLYKALQKAEKENEQRQAEGGEGFDASRLASSGAVRAAGGGRINWRVAGLATAVVLALAIGAAFFLVQPSTAPQPIASAPASPPVMQPPAPSEPAPASLAEAAPSEGQGDDTVTNEAAAEASEPASPEQVAAQEQAEPETMASADATNVPETAAEAGEPAAVIPPEPAVPPASARTTVAQVNPAPSQEPMPDLALDSPTRMLAPPVTIDRGDLALAGVGDAVRVRHVSQAAQDNAGAGYTALIRGEFDTALAFYEQALEQEPRSALALLGKGAALQKLGRSNEAQMAYDAVLRIDPKNREALTNLTAIVSERAPNEALARLADLEREYRNFSPVIAQMGLTHAKMGSMQQALDYLRRAVALTPEAVMYHYNLALVLDHMNLGDQAVRSYENVLVAMSGGRSVSGLSATDIERRVRYLRTR